MTENKGLSSITGLLERNAKRHRYSIHIGKCPYIGCASTNKDIFNQ